MLEVGDKAKVINPLSMHAGRVGWVHEGSGSSPKVVVNFLPKESGFLLESFYPYELDKVDEKEASK